MKQKTSNSIRALGNDENFITWFEFWHPKKAAALESEKEYNESVFNANANQDNLEASMTEKLSLMEKETKEKQMESFKMIAIVVVFAVMAFVVTKYV